MPRLSLNNHLNINIMKKLVLTAAFTLVGVIAVSAQTGTSQQSPSQNSNNPSTTQTQQNSQATTNWETTSGTSSQTKIQCTTATVESATLPTTASTETTTK
jgi:cytoskeletal protein RodZ